MENKRTVDIFLRLAIATAFIYPPIAAYIDPNSWIGYFPHFVQALPINTLYLLHGFGAIEILIGILVLFMKRPFLGSAGAALILLVIVLLNLSQFDVLFRDVSILFAACALAMLHLPKKEVQ